MMHYLEEKNNVFQGSQAFGKNETRLRQILGFVTFGQHALHNAFRSNIQSTFR